MKSSKNFNSRVQELVVTNLLSAGVESSRLVEFLNSCGCDTDKMLRVALYLNGSLDKETPRDVVVDNGKVLVATNYNFFDDVVSYETSFETTRWFTSEEDANKWASESRPYAYSGNDRETERYCFPATAVVRTTGSTNLQSWESKQAPTAEQLESVLGKPYPLGA